MIRDPNSVILRLISQVCVVALSFSTLAQTVAEKKSQTKISDAQSLESQRRTFAISLVTSLADEARNYDDRALRSRVLARAADTLWNADPDTARMLFRKAWEAAEKGDAEELTLKNLDDVPSTAVAMVTALRRSGGYDLRADVLALAAKRDQILGEEFLNKLKQGTDGDIVDRKNDISSQNSNNSPEAVSKRLNLASKLLDEGEVERALDFATHALNQVNANSIGFLSRLREKRPEAADQRFALLLARAEFDPSSDANTVSGLSSYVFTPGFYITFNKDGSARWSQPESSAPLRTPNLPATLFNKFFQVAAVILLRPLPPPDQDFTTS